MDMLKTKTGKEFESDYLAVIPTPPQAYIRVNAPVTTVASVFSNPEETLQMWHGINYLSGYTKLVAIIPEPDAIKVCLAKEVT